MKDFLVRLLLVFGVITVSSAPEHDEASWGEFLFVFIGAILLSAYHTFTARKE